jgi:hypothetical protein
VVEEEASAEAEADLEEEMEVEAQGASEGVEVGVLEEDQEVVIEKLLCTKLLVISVRKAVKFLFSQPILNQSIVRNVLI